MFTPDAATAGGDIAEMRAVITTAEPLEALAAAGRTAPTQAIRVVLSSLDDARASRMLDGGQADLLLGLPLSTDEVAACLDQIVGGRSALVRGGASKTVSAGTLSFRGRHVLIADDSPVNREVLIEALARVGIEATCVEDGRQAVAAVKSRAFDLVFMDGSMPVLDGFEATREIRAWEAGQGRSALPIVAVTAHVVGAQADLWRSSGMSDCVTKPYTLQRLHTCLLRWLGEASTAAPLQAHAEPHVAPEPVAPAVPAPAAVPDAVPEAAGPSVVALFDDTVLDSVRSMQRPGDDLVGRVLGLYRQHAPRALEALRKQVASGDGVAIANAAHALKSLSRNIGALRVGDLCDELETVSRLGDVANAEVLCASIAVSLEETLGVLDSRAREKAA
jgi:two-component system sensor histidine kinase BarA